MAEMLKNLNLTIEIERNENGTYTIWIGEENGSGAAYTVSSMKEVSQKIDFYLETYVKERMEKDA